MSIYVETLIRAPMEALWAHTQTPALHEKWDLRFSRIDYLPKSHEDEPQRFRYIRRIGFGFEVIGHGETVGERNLADGSRSSALKFGTHDRFSIIREGSGYWKYIPTKDGIRFLTGYDYDTRFGWAGKLVDRWVFRPLIGWATAWSFDRLRLWLERGVDPASSMRQALIHSIARGTLAVIFIYQGIVPKLIARHVDELAMLRDAGISPLISDMTLRALGLSEGAFAIILLAVWTSRWPLWMCLIAMLGATALVGIHSPRFFEAAFNPFSLNAAVAAIAAMDLLILGGVPSAARCLRRPL
jgi:DoxX-like family